MANSDHSEYPEFWYKGHFYPGHFDRAAVENIHTFPFKDGDVLVLCFVKSGTNWLVHMLMKMYDFWGLCSLGEFRDACGVDWRTLAPNLKSVRHEWNKALEEQIDTIPSPRLLRSHFPAEILCPEKHLKEKKLKIICLSRNPKDVCVSWYKFMEDFSDGDWAVKDFDEAVDAFVKGRVFNGPWLEYVTSWHKFDRSDGVLHVKYEDMKLNATGVIAEMADFLGHPLTEAKIQQVAESTTFEAMKSNPSSVALTRDVKNFLRKGVIGDWKNYFTVAQNEYFDKDITSKATERGMVFTYE